MYKDDPQYRTCILCRVFIVGILYIVHILFINCMTVNYSTFYYHFGKIYVHAVGVCMNICVCFCVYVCDYVFYVCVWMFLCLGMYVYIYIWILTNTHYNTYDLLRFSNNGLKCIDGALALSFSD